MESLLLSLLNRNALRLHDSNGRPIGEKVYPELFDNIKTKESSCPYRDSRRDNAKLMNVSALNDIAKSWKTILYFFGKVNRSLRSNSDSVGIYSDFWRSWVIATYLPEYLNLKHDSPVTDGNIPIFAAGVYKVSVGFINSTIDLVIKEALHQELPELTSEFIYKHADTEGELIARDCAHKSGVCAGPPNLIMEAAHSMIKEPNFYHDEQLEEEIRNYIDDFEGYVKFALAAFGVSLTTMLYASELTRGDRVIGPSRFTKILHESFDASDLNNPEKISQTAIVLLKEANRLADLSDNHFEIVRCKFLSMVGLNIDSVYPPATRNTNDVNDELFQSFSADVGKKYFPHVTNIFKIMASSLGYSNFADWQINHSVLSNFYGWTSEG